MLFEKKLVF